MADKTLWALILGCSSGFGEATVLELARLGYNIFGVHLDRRATLPHVEEIAGKIREARREAVFMNTNAADPQKKKRSDWANPGIVSEATGDGPRIASFAGLRHLAAFVGKGRRNATADGDDLQRDGPQPGPTGRRAWWAAGLMEQGGRIFAMTSSGGTRVMPSYGPVSAAKAILESHVRQLAMELAPRGITANAIRAGVTDTPALRKIPGHEKLIESARLRNPYGRLTTPEDVASAIGVLAQPNAYWITGDVIGVDGGEDVIG